MTSTNADADQRAVTAAASWWADRLSPTGARRSDIETVLDAAIDAAGYRPLTITSADDDPVLSAALTALGSNSTARQLCGPNARTVIDRRVTLAADRGEPLHVISHHST